MPDHLPPRLMVMLMNDDSRTIVDIAKRFSSDDGPRWIVLGKSELMNHDTFVEHLEENNLVEGGQFPTH